MDGVLLSFCPVCGWMLPLLDGVDVEILSNTQKKKLGVQFAKTHHLDYKKVNDVVRKISEKDKEVFLATLSVTLTGEGV